jgi:hypothetical protein
MKYTVEVISCGVIDIINFEMTVSDIQKLLGGIHIQTHRQQGDITSLHLFLQIKESRIRIPKSIFKHITVTFNINILLINISQLIVIMA